MTLVKNSNTEFDENLTNDLLAGTRGQTDGFPCKVFVFVFFLLSKNA